MVRHFKNYFTWIKQQIKIDKRSKCIEVGSNDGTMLKNFKNSGLNCLGIEPSKNVAQYAKKASNVLNKFFVIKVSKLSNYKNKLI